MPTTYQQKLISLIFSVSILSLGIIYLVSAWTEPSSNPPQGNVSAPLNVGSSAQSKVGGLILNTGGATSGLIVYSGNVGIGTLIPSSTLVVSTSTESGGILKLQNTRNQANDTWWIGFTHGNNSLDTNDRARIGVNIKGGGEGRLVFYTGPGGGQTERLRIDEKGNVGIGTTNPTQKLDVAGYVRGQQGLCIGNDCRTSWPTTGGAVRTCPNGYSKVNESYCINTNERSATTWFNANIACRQENARLCTKGEFHYACTVAESRGILNMTDGDTEWLEGRDDIGDNYQDRSMMGGGTSCTDTIKGKRSSEDAVYRCCYDLY